MRTIVVFLFGATVAPSAYASVNENFCFRWPIGFEDQDSTLGDDYFTSETSVPARGAKVKITRSDGYVVYDDYVNAVDTEPGCTGSLTLNQFFTYTLQINSRAFVSGNILKAYDDDSTPAEKTHLWVGTTISGGTLTRTTPIHQQWSTIAAMSWAMYRRNLGLTGTTLNAYNQNCPTTGQLNACCKDEQMYVPNNRKYQIVDVMGECIAERLNEGNTSNGPTGMAESPCQGITASSHEMISKEVNKTSAWYGFAHYYAATAFNRTDQSDCMFYYWYEQDWGRAGHGFGDASQRIDCAEGMDAWFIDSYDYKADYCEDGWMPTIYNTATEYDWLRFWWDMDMEEGLTSSEIATIVDDANLHTCDDTLWWGDDDTCANHLIQASIDGGFETEYDQELINGHWFAQGS